VGVTNLSAERTLVKSPPELWSELSDAQSLAKHLGEFGEIRITKLEPEHTVAWEGDLALGTARIEPSGWGTKVTITVRLANEPEVPEEFIEEPPPPGPDPDPALAGPESALTAARSALDQATRKHGEACDAFAKAEAAQPEEPEPAEKPGFFARLFGAAKRAEEERQAERERRSKEFEAKLARASAWRDEAAKLKAEAEARVAEAQDALETARRAEEERKHEAERKLVRWRELEARRRAAEAQAAPKLDAETSQGLLEQVLDHLGSAHHRPFSRS
jgi:hypothetical protein